MSGNLHDLIKSRLAGSDLNAEARALALAAVSGESNLASALAGVTPLPVPASAAGPLAAGGTYLRSIDVEGFRGVGPASRLDLNPGPGLTLIVGRNGSGKSSFAEGLEILLTSNNRRWSNRAAEWKGGWRNLHHGDTVRVSAEFIQEGNDKSTRVERSWAKDADLDKSTSFAQVHGKTRGEVADLGWAAALSTLRPILSYNELGSLLDEGPSKLYDALAAVLGLDELTAASDRLKKAATERSRTERDAKKEAKDVLVPRLAESDDARAVALAEMLGKRTVNLESIGKLVTDPGAAATGDITTLNAIANLAVPDAEEIREAAGRLREAHRDVEAVVGTEAGRARALASLLQQALAVHQHSGDGPCPVCGTGSIDAAWRKQAGQQIVKLKKQADEAEQANTKFNRARSELGSLMTSPPTILNEAASVGLDAKDAIAAWERWAALGAEPDVAVLIEKVEKAAGAFAATLQTLVNAARVELDRREDVWRPLALMVAGWTSRMRAAEQQALAVVPIKSAEGWLQDQMEELRNERFEPIAAKAKGVFELMRHDSHVQLGGVELDGTGTRRRVRLRVTVDGVDGAALAVMSQGELNALALSLFLPRATLDESPFRFVVIDDPVQAMDPNRVDGLSRALEETARTRQVIVFTHDERLPAAVRRLGIPATVIEVQRRDHSVVELDTVDEPVKRYLDDARALALTQELPEGVKARVLPGFLRLAIEAACHEVTWRRRLAAGQRHSEIESLLVEWNTTKQLVALAIFDDANRAGEVMGKLNSWGSRLADAYRLINEGVHGDRPGGFGELVNATQTLVKRIREQK